MPNLKQHLETLVAQTVKAELAAIESKIQPIVQSALSRMLGFSQPGPSRAKRRPRKPIAKRRHISATGRARLAAAQKARWERWRREKAQKTAEKKISAVIRPRPAPSKASAKAGAPAKSAKTPAKSPAGVKTRGFVPKPPAQQQ